MTDFNLSHDGRHRNIRHGHARTDCRTPEYLAYNAMKQRCFNNHRKGWEHWGGKGVTIYPEWLGENGFATWLSYVGCRPSPTHSLDRFPNRDGNYEPGNVRWATRQEQNSNTVSSILVTHDGRTACLKEWSRLVGMSYSTLKFRYDNNWPFHLAISVPKGARLKSLLRQT